MKPRTPRKARKKTSRKSAGARSRTSSSGTSLKGKVDALLTGISPSLQKKMDELITTLRDGEREVRGDLSFLAGQILRRAQEISRDLQEMKPRRRVNKRGRKK